MKNKVLTLTVVLALLAVVGKYYAVPVLAQTIRPALVKNSDEPGRMPYTSLTASYNALGCHLNCTPGSALDMGATFGLLPIVPSGKRLIVNHVFGGMNSTGQLLSVGIGTASFAEFDFQFDRLFFLGPFTFHNSSTYFDVQPLFLTFEPGTNVWVTPGKGNCDNCLGYIRVGGYLIDATN